MCLWFVCAVFVFVCAFFVCLFLFLEIRVMYEIFLWIPSWMFTNSVVLELQESLSSFVTCVCSYARSQSFRLFAFYSLLFLISPFGVFLVFLPYKGCFMFGNRWNIRRKWGKTAHSGKEKRCFGGEGKRAERNKYWTSWSTRLHRVRGKVLTNVKKPFY